LSFESSQTYFMILQPLYNISKKIKTNKKQQQKHKQKNYDETEQVIQF